MAAGGSAGQALTCDPNIGGGGLSMCRESVNQTHLIIDVVSRAQKIPQISLDTVIVHLNIVIP